MARGGGSKSSSWWRLATALAALLALWFGGFLQFVSSLPTQASDDGRETDAIVVLTGGAARIDEGLRLLEAGRAERVLISGVDRGIGLADLRRHSTAAATTFACCVSLGHEAADTQGNAIEAAIWMREAGYKSLRLVTASYHMPRGLLFFDNRMPDIEVLAHPVFPPAVHLEEWWRYPATARLIADEFNKYILGLLTVRLAGAETSGTKPGETARARGG